MSNEVKLKFKSEYDGKGAEKAKTSVKGVASETKKATATMSAFGSIAGMTSGPVGKLAMAVKGLSAAFMANPLIAAVALLSALGAGLKYLYDRAEKAKQALAELREKALAKMIKDMDNLRLDNLNKQLAQATTEAQKAEKAFLKMADAKKKITQGQTDIQQAKAGLGMAQMEQDKQAAIAAEPSESKRVVIGAKFDREIAQVEGKMQIDAAEAALKAAEKQMETAGSVMAERARVEARAQEALRTAQKEFDATVGNDEARIKTFEGKRNEAQAASEEATSAYIDAENDYRQSQQEIQVKRLALEKANVQAQTKIAAAFKNEKEIKDEYNSLLEKQKLAQEKHQKVIDAIQRQTERQKTAAEKIANLEESIKNKLAARENALALGAGGFHEQEQGKRDAEKERAKATAKEERAVNALKSRRVRTEKDEARIRDFQNWKDAANQNIGEDNALLTALKDSASSQKENLAELKKLNQNIEEAITVP